MPPSPRWAILGLLVALSACSGEQVPAAGHLAAPLAEPTRPAAQTELPLEELLCQPRPSTQEDADPLAPPAPLTTRQVRLEVARQLGRSGQLRQVAGQDCHKKGIAAAVDVLPEFFDRLCAEEACVELLLQAPGAAGGGVLLEAHTAPVVSALLAHQSDPRFCCTPVFGFLSELKGEGWSEDRRWLAACLGHGSQPSPSGRSAEAVQTEKLTMIELARQLPPDPVIDALARGRIARPSELGHVQARMVAFIRGDARALPTEQLARYVDGMSCSGIQQVAAAPELAGREHQEVLRDALQSCAAEPVEWDD